MKDLRSQGKIGSMAETTHYSKMAKYYDAVYKGIVDYGAQADLVERIFAEHHRREVKSLLDAACGTGNYTFVFASKGYDVTGIDLSEEMISVARGKSGSGRNAPEFLVMDIRQMTFEDGRTFDAAVVLFGGFGYLLEVDEVRSFLAGARKLLRPGGLLVFEFWHNAAVLPAAATAGGQKGYDKALDDGGNEIVRLSLSKYDPMTNRLSVTFEFYVIDSKRVMLADRFSETHVLKTYTISEMGRLLEAAGFEALAFYDGDLRRKEPDLLEPAKQSTFRVMAVAKPDRGDSLQR